MRYVLFVRTHNAGRSQMAQAFFEERYAPDDIRAESAGEDPATEIWPGVVEAMAEVGIDISKRRPKKLPTEMQLHADWAVTLACGARCPYVPTTVEDWDVPDPPAYRSNRCDRSAMRSSAGCATWRPTGSRRSEATAARTTPASRACSRRSSPSFKGFAQRRRFGACADVILDDYDEVPIRSMLMTLATRRARECLRAERCDVLAPVQATATDSLDS